MSPSAAFASEVFGTYVRLAAGLLVIAGAAIGISKWLLNRDVAHAWAAYRGWLVMTPLVVGCIFLGRAATIVFFTTVAALGFREYARATGLRSDWSMTATVYLGIVAVGVTSFVRDPGTGATGWYGLFMALPVYVIASILLIPIIRNTSQGQLKAISLAIVGFIYIGWMFGHVAYLANAEHANGYLLYLLFAVEVNDIAAFTCGSLFGRRPLRSNISPKKTLEGSLGAVAVSLALPWALHFSFPHFDGWECLLTGLIVGIGGQLGDLSMSVVKRDLDIKDMGTAIRGHGGILDRIDSLIYVAPLFFHMTRYFHGL